MADPEGVSDDAESVDESTPERPVVARYTDFRRFIADMVVYLRATKKKWSYRYFARTAGFSSPSFLKLVEQGKRNISASSIDRFAKGLGLEGRERDVFETLVLLGQAENDESRNRYYARLKSVTKGDPTVRLQGDQFEAYSRWYTFVIRELINLPGFDEDPTVLARRMRPRIRPHQAKQALILLERLGLVRRTEDGTLETAEQTISTGPEVRTLAVRNFHRAMLELSIRALDRIPKSDRNITSLTLTLTRQQYDQVCERITRLRREILELSEAAPEDGAEPGERQVYQITFPVVPVTQKARK